MIYPEINSKVTNSWKQLQEHFKNTKNISLQKLFLENSSREKEYTYSIPNFKIDFSRNHLDKKTLSLLIDLAKKSGLPQKMEDLFTGKKINHTENRAVLHTALRDYSDKEIIVDNVNVTPLIKKNLKNLETFTNQIIQGERKGYTNKKFTDIVNIGIGGSDLGPKMAVESLAFYKNHLNTHFVSNIDGDHVTEIVKKINPETTLFIIVSKSFSTQETLSNANFIRDWFIEKAGIKNVAKHFVAVSTNIKKVVDFGIEKNNIFPMWNWVGGRFSLWSSVGLSIALSIGFNNFTELLKGANQMDSHFRNTDFEHNLPIISALISIWYNNFYLVESQVILPYASYLQNFVPFIQQLSMESNGKSVDVNGKPIHYQTGNIIWGNVGTNAQHAFMQLLHQGTKMIPVEFISFQKELYPNTNQQIKLNDNLLAQATALCFGKTKDKAFLDLKLQNGNIKLLPYKVFKGNKPSTIITLNSLTPNSLGQLISFYEHKTFVQGIIWNINSFDQFGVELGKELLQNK